MQTIEESKKVDLLGITRYHFVLLGINNHLTFNEHIDNLYRTANYKLHVLRGIRKYLCNAFINSQFSYAPLVWMFCRKKKY